MLLTLKWLQKFVPELEIADLAEFKDRVDTRLSEVERVEKRGEALSGLLVARVDSVEPHPTHKNLTVCRVDVGGNELRQIVCGADNVRADMWSVAVLPGGSVYAGGEVLNIGVRSVAGVESHGMLCAPDELGLNDDHRGIIEIDQTLPIGTDVTEMFRDVVIEIENKALPHRPDAFSHLGVARELAAIFDLELKTPTPEIPQVGYVEKELDIDIENKVPELTPRYTSMVFNNVKVGPSPLWLQILLAYAGERSINNIVDLTNFVMQHIGQPLHAFDANKIAGNKVVIRKAKQGEKLVALDKNEYALSEDVVVIADTEKPIALAGIMGGLETGVTAATTHILVESANFEMYSVRRTSRQLGLRTQASTRYEKGQNAEQAMIGLKLAAEMLVHQNAAEIGSDIQDHYLQPEPKKVIEFDLAKVRKLIGADIAKADVVDSLERLGFELDGDEKYASADLARGDVGFVIDVQVPYWRRDVNQDVDLLEEVGRIYGYENIQATLPKRDLQGPRQNKNWSRLTEIKQNLAAHGLYEVLTYSMVGEELYKQNLRDSKPLWRIASPISPELALVRNAILPSLVEKAEVNLQRYEDFGLFEISRIARKELDESGELPEQPYHLAALRAAPTGTSAFGNLKYAFDQLNKQVFHNHLSIIQLDQDEVPTYLHPGKCGAVVHQNAKKPIGYIGMLHPLIKENLRISGEIAVWEIDLGSLLASEDVWTPTTYQNLNHFPIATRDISFWLKERSFIADTLDALRAELGEKLFDLELIDIFEDEKKNRRSATVRLKLQADHTLTAEEITALMEKATAVINGHEHKLR